MLSGILLFHSIIQFAVKFNSKFSPLERVAARPKKWTGFAYYSARISIILHKLFLYNRGISESILGE